MTPVLNRARDQQAEAPASGGDRVSFSAIPQQPEAEVKARPSPPNLASQFRVGLCLALSTVGAVAAVVPSLSEASQKVSMAQVQVQRQPQEKAPNLTEGWLLAGPSVTQSSVEEIKLPPPPPPAFRPSKPVTQKGDYVAHGVNFSHLLTDAEFVDTTAATSQDIQAFLEDKNSFLAEFEIDGLKASDMIVEVAQQEGVNPWLVVTTMEKENSMVSRQRQPKKGVMNAAMGYGHTDGGNVAGKRNNFENQIRRGVALLKELYDEGRQQEFPKKMKVDFGKRKIQVRNAATYALMRYTPHTVDTSLRKVGGGNYLFRHILEDFTQQAADLRAPLSGTLIAGD